ncbi:hypothetical protein [Burkholderia cenocepacia]|uniref:hypothetical protein n=2 Tax=Burkholderia cenocepacia TaxID=95486 RepID=UPI0011778DBF|nr:hypothetical protein [Burkholderia cenocepacia]MBR8264813.1 hypothetical protein [Burkholderia cenocepacia]
MPELPSPHAFWITFFRLAYQLHNIINIIKMKTIPSKLQIAEIFEILERATTDKRPARPLTKYEEKIEKFTKFLVSHQLTGFIASLLLAAIAFFSDDVTVAHTAFATLTLVELFALPLGIAVILISAPFIYRLFKEPFHQFFYIAESSAEFDAKYIDELSQYDPTALRYALTYYEGERISLEKRSSLLCGSVERIGIFPALAGLGALSLSLSKLSILQGWASSLIFLIFAFYILNTTTFAMTQRQDRVISLLKFCIDISK